MSDPFFDKIWLKFKIVKKCTQIFILHGKLTKIGLILSGWALLFFFFFSFVFSLNVLYFEEKHLTKRP